MEILLIFDIPTLPVLFICEIFIAKISVIMPVYNNHFE